MLLGPDRWAIWENDLYILKRHLKQWFSCTSTPFNTKYFLASNYGEHSSYTTSSSRHESFLLQYMDFLLRSLLTFAV